MGGHKWNPVDWIKDGLTKYRANAAEDLVAMVKVTVPSGEHTSCNNDAFHLKIN